MAGVNVAAVDLGASSGRVVLGSVGPRELRIEAVARFANDPVRLVDGLHWNLLELFAQSLRGLRSAAAAAPDGLASVGIDSWAVDYGLLRAGRLLGVPYHYRDSRSGAGVDRVHASVPHAELYGRNGLQFLPFNTLYQLAAEPDLALADRLLLVPDLLAHWLTGSVATEVTNASTTGLLGHDGRWDDDLIERLGYPRGLFGPLVDPGTPLGGLLPHIAGHLGDPGTSVTAVGSHDTASAVVAVPMAANSAYLSLGTWGLVGVELEHPVVTPESRAANFTNERGVGGRTRFLTNVMGTWLLSETLRAWERAGSPRGLPELLAAAADVTGLVPVFDVQDPRFLPPGDMPARITEWFAERDVQAPHDPAGLVRSIVESLAVAYATALDRAEALSGRRVATVHVVGGGSQNRLLCQAIADRSGRPVVAGPVEATALGNVLVQAGALGAIPADLEAMRRLVADTHDLVRFEPRTLSASTHLSLGEE